jgi:hypothetical protein
MSNDETLYRGLCSAIEKFNGCPQISVHNNKRRLINQNTGFPDLTIEEVSKKKKTESTPHSHNIITFSNLFERPYDEPPKKEPSNDSPSTDIESGDKKNIAIGTDHQLEPTNSYKFYNIQSARNFHFPSYGLSEESAQTDYNLSDLIRIDDLKHLNDTPTNPIFNVVKYDKSAKPFGRSKEISCVIEKDTDCALSSIRIIRKEENKGLPFYVKEDHTDGKRC